MVETIYAFLDKKELEERPVGRIMNFNISKVTCRDDQKE